MDTIEFAITRARKEFEDDGVLSLTTVMKLNALGLDVPALEEQFANS